MRSRERLAETLRSINAKVFERQYIGSGEAPRQGFIAFFPQLAKLIEEGKRDEIYHADLYLMKSTSPHYEDLIAEAKLYLGMPF